MVLKQFQVVDIFGFSMRATEIVFAMFFVVYILSLVNSSIKYSPRISTPTQPKQFRAIGSYSLILILFFAIAGINGYISKNSGFLSDFRGIFCLAFSPMFFSCVKSPEDLQKVFKILYVMLVFLSISNLLTIKYSIYNQIGNVSNLTAFMSLYLFCLAVSFYKYLPRHKPWNIGISFLAFMVCIVTLSKWMLLGTLTCIIASLFLSADRNTNSRVKLGVFFITIVVAFLIIYQQTGMGEYVIQKSWGYASFDDFYYYRYLRGDVGDISGGRFGLWGELWDKILEKPFIGHGIGAKVDTLFLHGSYIQEHNLIFWLLIRLGFIGTFISLILAVKFYKFGYFVYRNEGNRLNKALLHASLTYLVGCFAINLVGLHFFIFEVAVIFWMNIAVIFLIFRWQLEKKRHYG